MRRLVGSAAVFGGLVYAVAGGVMAARNLGWFGWAPDANSLFVWLGAGLALMVVGFGLRYGRDIRRSGVAGRIAAAAGISAPIILLLSRLIEFAIFGTLATFVAIAAFTVTVHRGRLLGRLEVVLLYVATVASITWNTETASAALLVVVGLIGAWVAYRALVSDRWGLQANSR
jgi:hypothetical protein